MAKVLVLYYSMYGHIERMAEAVAEGAREVAGAEVDRQARARNDAAKTSRARPAARLDQPAPIAQPAELADYDAILFGTPTRFGNMAAQMRNFLDQTGELWLPGALVGKVGSVFTCTATQHGGQESTILTFHTTLLHHGMIIVGLPYAEQGLMDIDEIKGGSPYGAGDDRRRQGQRSRARRSWRWRRFQGRHVAGSRRSCATGRRAERPPWRRVRAMAVADRPGAVTAG